MAGTGGGGYRGGEYSNSASPIGEDGSGFQESTGESNAGQTEPCAGNPIVMSTGNKIEPERDFIGGGEMPLSLARTYNHFWQGVGLFGKYWISNLDYKLTFGTMAVDACYPRPGGSTCGIGGNTIVYAWRPDGRTIRYVKNVSDGVFYEAKPSPVSKIVKQADGSFVLHSDDNRKETYTPSGYLSSVKNELGVGWTLSYSGTFPTQVVHTSGRSMTLSWSNGLLVGLRDPAGNQYSYSYNANQFGAGLHRLASTLRPGAPASTITYHYEVGSDSSALTGKSINGARYSTFAYQADGAAISSEHSGFERYTFSYTTGPGTNLTTNVVNPLGKSTTYLFQDGRLSSVTGHPSTYCPATTSVTTAYDSNGFPSLKTDADGNQTSYTYNSKGQLSQMVEGYGSAVARTTQYTWDTAYNRVLSATAVGRSQTTYGYTSGNLISSISTTNLSAPSPATNLNQVRTTTLSYAYHSNGMLESETIDGPLAGSSDVQVSRYDSAGNLLSVTDGLGHAITYANHDAFGRPGWINGPNGDATEYVYDARGRLMLRRQHISGAWQSTHFYYNALDKLSAVRTPDGQWVVSQYDVAGRRTSEYYPEGSGAYARTRYTYNNASLPTRIDTERVTGEVLPGPPPQSAATLSAPASNATGSYSVSWSVVSGATAYQLEENVDNAGWAISETLPGTSKAFSGKPAASFGYRVTACTSLGCGPYSASATTVVSYPAPSAAPVLDVPPDSVGSYTVSWSMVATATTYLIEERVNQGAWTQVYSGSGASLARTKPNGDYGYRARACNANGCSPYSSEAWINVRREPCPTCRSAPMGAAGTAVARDLGEGA